MKNLDKPGPRNASNSLDISFNLRACLIGEAMLSNGKCALCEQGTYLLQASDEPGFCRKCPSLEAECFGGSAIFPKSGYWRSSNESDNFIKCLNPIACLGGSNSNASQCQEGYQGILFSDCALGYSKSLASFKCSNCPSRASNIIILIVVIIGVALFLTLLIVSNLNSALKDKNYLAVFLRVLLNHLQVLTLSGSFDLNWPSMLLSFYRNIQPFGETSSQILSLDCFLNSYSKDNLQRVFLIRVMILAGLPIIAIGVSYAVWNIIIKIKLKSTGKMEILQNSDRNSGIENQKKQDYEIYSSCQTPWQKFDPNVEYVKVEMIQKQDRVSNESYVQSNTFSKYKSERE
ncbi:hypothetical protein FGO68_gene13540 [Halteria grandinella]|uniref:Uncharacterized protein n=1 Tax=Halteria grandinella TaxID=5974 RepID=A0A8J8NI59_HALGN|nr:hypothetical protein FGO68_gene13540 [Halteria grandinella]